MTPKASKTRGSCEPVPLARPAVGERDDGPLTTEGRARPLLIALLFSLAAGPSSAAPVARGRAASGPHSGKATPGGASLMRTMVETLVRRGAAP